MPSMIEAAQAAWHLYGDCELDNWRIEGYHVKASGIPKRARQEYLHVFTFDLGPKVNQVTLTTILRAPWHQRIRYNSRTGMPTVPRHLYKQVPATNSYWIPDYIADVPKELRY